MQDVTHRSQSCRAAFLFALVALFAGVPAALAQPPTINCNTHFLASSQFNELFAVDITTGASSFIGLMPATLATEVEFDTATDTLWSEEVNGLPALHVIAANTAASLGSVTHAFGALNGLEFVGSTLYGTFIANTGAPSDLVIVNTTTGAFTTIGATGFGPISGLAYNERSGVMYGITAGGAAADLVTVNLSTGTATVVGPTGLDRIGSIEFGPDGNLYGGLTDIALANARFLVRIDPATGAATPVADTGFSISGLTACALQPQRPPTPVPALSGFGLVLLALVLLAAASLRRFRPRGAP